VEDIAFDIRKETNMRGADVVIEASGNQSALREAIRIAAPDTAVTALGWYQGQCTSLDLSEEFHHNRISLRSSQIGGISPEIQHMWNSDRREEACYHLLMKLKLDNLITHRIRHEDAAEAYRLIDEKDKGVIQVVLTY
ncbi:MAG: zinc-binding alcohol dehydrogenase, partial [Clostridia bacterium]|nr:zinc-binding alcohol dehydrogenase [Clostridia bacterium]